MNMIDYPDELSEADWKRQRGAIVKLMPKKTGITEALHALESAFKKLNQKIMDVDSVCYDCKTSEAVEKKYTEACRYYEHEIPGLRKLVAALRTLAKTTAKEFLASKVVPKKVREYVETMVTSANDFDKDLTSLFQTMADRFIERTKQFRVIEEEVRKQFTDVLAKFPGELQEIKKVIESNSNQSLKQFQKFWQESVRSVAAVLQKCNFDSLKKHLDTWAKLNSGNYGKLEEPEKIKLYLQALEVAFGKLQTDVKKLK